MNRGHGLARRLTRKGYVIGLASSARRNWLERVQRDAVDLVLLDIGWMPNVSGLDALKTLREQYSPAQLPIIIMVHGQKHKATDIVAALELGANDYLDEAY